MSPRTQFRCQISSDAQVLLALQRISEQLEQNPEECTLTINPMTDYGLDGFPLSELQNKPFVQFVQDKATATWDRVSVDFTALGFSLAIIRDRQEGDDDIHVTFHGDRNRKPDPLDVGRALDAIQHHFRPRNQSVALERALGPELAEFYRLREDSLSRLESLTQKVVRETHDYRLRLDHELAEHKRSLTASFDETKQELDATYERRNADLQALEQNLESRRQELDDRSARHARREQSRALQEKISERSAGFGLTADTRKKRWAIHAIFALLLVVSGTLIVRSLLFPQTPSNDVLFWVEAARVPLGVLGFGLTAVFYIRWNDRWFRQHADQEFRLQHLALDVDRAGYAAEMLLEWQESKRGEMPGLMLDRLTTGLFTDQTTAARARHPAEDVTNALLKASSRVSVDVPGIGEVTFTGRGLRRLDRDLQKRDEE